MGSKRQICTTIVDPKDPTGTTFINTGQYQLIDDRNLEEAQADTLGRLRHVYDDAIEAGFNYQGKNFQIDESSLININGAATIATITLANAGQWSANFFWIANDNTRMPLDAPGMIVFGMAVGSYYTTLVLTNRALKDAIAALKDVPSCDAFDVTQGWPKN